MGEEENKIKEPKKRISRPLANSRVRTLARETIENPCRMCGIDPTKMSPEELKSKQAEIFDILMESFKKDFEIINPGDC